MRYAERYVSEIRSRASARGGAGDIANGESFAGPGLVVATAFSATSCCPPARSIRSAPTRSESSPPRRRAGHTARLPLRLAPIRRLVRPPRVARAAGHLAFNSSGLRWGTSRTRTRAEGHGAPGSALPVGSAAVEGVLNDLAGGELRGFERRDRDRRAGLRVTALALAAFGVRVALLENYILELEVANDTLQRQNFELIDRGKTLKSML
jgi:hypothetical protein